MDLEWGDTSRSSMEEEIPKEMFEENYDDENLVLQEEANFFDAWQQQRHSNTWHFRCIQPCDRQRIQELHEEWFPVRYQNEFYDDLVHGKMCHTGEDLYSNLAIQDHHIAACIVAAIVPAKRLNQASRQLLLPDPHHHQSACYIMTLGTVTQYRNAGLATRLVEKCIHDLVLSDRSCGALYLHVITSNHSAIRFYERLGFWRVQEIQDYYTIDNQYHNCYLYAKYFNEDTWISFKFYHGGFPPFGTRLKFLLLYLSKEVLPIGLRAIDDGITTIHWPLKKLECCG